MGSATIAVIGAILLPFWAEDANILFHRANYTDLPVLFYYQGYISLPAQVIAALVTPLPAYLQAAAYAAASLSIWVLMLVAYVSVAPTTFVLFAGLAYFFVFDPIYVFNLTFSLWPALVFIGLVGVRCQLEHRPVRWWEAVAVAILSMSSPLSIVMALPFAPVVLAHRGSAPTWVAFLACLAAYPLLTQPGAGASSDLIGRIAARSAEIAANPGIVFSVAGDRLPVSPPRLLRVGTLLLSLGFVFLSLLPTIRRRYGALLPFVMASLLIFLVSLSRSSGETIGTRYMFPVIFAGFLIAAFLLGNLLPRMASSRLRLGAYGGLLAGGIALCLAEQPDLSHGLQTFQKLRTAQMSSNASPVFLVRPGPFDENDWTVAVGNFSLSAEDCDADKSNIVARFKTYCGPGEIWLPQ